MTEPVPRNVLVKLRKLAQLPEEARRSRFAVSITRLTTLKSLCQEPATANRFVTYLARKTLERVEREQGRSRHPDTAKDRAHRQMMAEALAEMDAWLRQPTEARRQGLWALLRRMEAEQNEHKNIPWGAVRLIHDADLLVCEYALRCLLEHHAAGHWAYQVARQYAERYDPSHGTGLIPKSAPLVQDIADFWMQEFGLGPESITAPARTNKRTEERAPSRRAGKSAAGRQHKVRFTHRQGQFLAFIRLYRTLHRQGPAESDMAKFFCLTPPAVHGMVVKLGELGLITRKPGVARSLRVAVPREKVPDLEEVGGPPW